MICSLSTTFFYQNCSEVDNTMASASQIEYLPLFTNQQKLFESPPASKSCGKINEVLYSNSFNLCFEVKDSCVYASLVKNGFSAVDKSMGNKIKPDLEVINLDQIEGEAALSSQDSAPDTLNSEPDLEARIKNCQIFVDINDLKPSDFLVVDINELGYSSAKDEMCSMSLVPMVNFKNRTCLTATDGCQATFLRKNGYVKDYFSICPQVP
jgi:hypothetical protein